MSHLIFLYHNVTTNCIKVLSNSNGANLIAFQFIPYNPIVCEGLNCHTLKNKYFVICSVEFS